MDGDFHCGHEWSSVAEDDSVEQSPRVCAFRCWSICLQSVDSRRPDSAGTDWLAVGLSSNGARHISPALHVHQSSTAYHWLDTIVVRPDVGQLEA